MSTFLRFAVTFQSTIAIAIGAFFYHEVFVQHLLEFAPQSGPFAAPVTHIQYIVPIVLATFLAAVWTWMIYGVVQDERPAQDRTARARTRPLP